MNRRALLVSAIAAGVMCACGSREPPAAASSSATPAALPADEPSASAPAAQSAKPEAAPSYALAPFTGDLDAMLQRRQIRLGVTFNRTFYFVDQGVQRGVAYEYGRLLQDELNKTLRTGNLKLHVVFVPLPRDMLAPALADGRIDAVVAQVTVTPDKQQLVDFSNPTRRNVSEVVVTGPGAPSVSTVEDLSGRGVYVRKGTTYHQSLLAVNERLVGQRKAPILIRFVPVELEDDDVLEMVNAGLIPITVVDDYLAAFWKKVFTDLTVHDDVAVRSGGELAVAFRKNSPQLAATLNAFLAKNGLGTVFGNIVQSRYLESTRFVKNAASEEDRRRFLALVSYFRKYSDRYSMDYLLMGAQAYQESGLDQNVKSRVGAIGIMQVMPATGRELNVGDIRQPEANIHAGVKYMRFMMDQYFKDEPMDRLNKGLFTLASYNAGPARVRQLRQEAGRRGLNPNVWFGHVEQIASERLGRETVTYVSNIYKYYVAYQLVVEQNDRRRAAKAAIGRVGAGK